MDLAKQIEIAVEREAKLTRTVVDLRSCKWTTPGGWAEDGPGHDSSTSLTLDDGEIYNLSPDALQQLLDRVFSGLHKISLRTTSDISEPLVNYWMAKMSENKALVVLKSENNYVRGVLGVDDADINTSTVLRLFSDTFKDYGGENLPVRLFHTEDPEGVYFYQQQHFRIYLPDDLSIKVPCGGDHELSFGVFFDVTLSDFAVGKFIVEMGLVDQVVNTCCLLRIDGDPLITRPYKLTLTDQEFLKVFAILQSSLSSELSRIDEKMQSVAQQSLTEEQLEDLKKQIPRYRDCSESFAKRLVDYFLEFPPTSRLSVFSSITLRASEENLPSRIKHEAFAARLLGIESELSVITN